MSGKALRALLQGIPMLLATLAALGLVTFTLSSLSPIDPALQLVGDHASAGTYVQARHELGLDAPWNVRLGRYLAAAAHGDLGVSRSTGRPVREDLERVFPATVELATLALIVGGVCGIGLALLSVRRSRGFIDGVARVVSLAGNSIPVFWLGLISLFFFYARLHWAPGTGRLSDAFEYTVDMRSGFVLLDAARASVPGALADAAAHLIMPVLILAAYALGNITRLTRAALMGEAGKEYVMLARAKGAGPQRVLLRHMLPNVRGFVLTVLALTYANLLEGAVLIETVFARPGIGRYLTTALFGADMPAILGATLLIGACFVIVNGVTDLAVRLMDPRLA